MWLHNRSVWPVGSSGYTLLLQLKDSVAILIMYNISTYVIVLILLNYMYEAFAILLQEISSTLDINYRIKQTAPKIHNVGF